MAIKSIAAAAFALALFGAVSAHAQNSQVAPNAGPGSGVTSGPAAGVPTTLGTGGQSAATPHQSDSMRNHGGPAVSNETQGQQGGTPASVKPGLPDAGAGEHKP